MLQTIYSSGFFLFILQNFDKPRSHFIISFFLLIKFKGSHISTGINPFHIFFLNEDSIRRGIFYSN